MEEYEPEEIRKYKKKHQDYQKTNGEAYKASGKYDENIFLIPTKTCPNPIKFDQQRKRKTEAAFMMAQKFAAMEEKAGEKFPIFVAIAAGGKIWDDTLKKDASYCEVITHPDPKIRERFATSGENEFR